MDFVFIFMGEILDPKQRSHKEIYSKNRFFVGNVILKGMGF